MTLRIVGKVSGYHGIKGEIKIYPLMDDLDQFKNFASLIIDGQNHKVTSVRMHKDFVLVCLDGINDLNQAELIKGIVEAELEEKLETNQYYIAELIGLKVYDQNNNEIGVITNYSKIGQKLVFIRLNEGFQARSELLIPFVEEYVIRVSLEERKFQINLTEDLLELCK